MNTVYFCGLRTKQKTKERKKKKNIPALISMQCGELLGENIISSWFFVHKLVFLIWGVFEIDQMILWVYWH